MKKFLISLVLVLATALSVKAQNNQTQVTTTITLNLNGLPQGCTLISVSAVGAVVTGTVSCTTPPPSTITSVTPTCNPNTIKASATSQCAAVVTGTGNFNTAVTWAASTGTISGTGLYTGPPATATANIKAVSVQDATKNGTTPVTVTAGGTPSQPGATCTVANNFQGCPLTDSKLNSWTFGGPNTTNPLGNIILLNGNPQSPTAAAIKLIYCNSVIVGQTSSGSWWQFNTDGTSTKLPGAPTCGTPPPVTSGAAFIGAQGGGAATPGGQGGVFYEVTTLDDLDGLCTQTTPTGFTGCSFRQAYVNAVGKRYIIFRKAGLFPNLGSDWRTYNPFVTIAGQTAPGEVILGGPNTKAAVGSVTTTDVVWRYVTMSPDNYNTPSGPDTGTVSSDTVNCPGLAGNLSAGGCHDIIWDHISWRWSGNKSWITTSNFTPGKNGNGNGTGPNHSLTVQWSLMYEPHEGHPVGYGTATDESCVGTRTNPDCLSPFETDIDFHHNLLVNVNHRIPENSNGSTRWSNNIIYNWGWYANEWLGAEIIDDRNNKFVCGNLNSLGAQKYPIHFTTNSPEMSGPPSVFVDGNIGCGQTTPPADQYGSLVNQITGENGAETGPIPDSWKRSTPMPDTKYPITLDLAVNLDAAVLDTIGNSRHLDCDGNWVSHRDAADTRIINQYKTGGDGGYWPNGVTYTGQSTIPKPLPDWQDNPVVNGTLCAESMHDGIPDQYKIAHGLSTTDPTVANSKAPNGYSWIENYLSGQVSSVASLKVNTSLWQKIKNTFKKATP